jgi:molybdenum cofactor cytidylyltransferase
MISAIVLAAGQSKRMGRPKMVLPWGHTTVITHVLSTLIQGGLTDIIVITGGNHEEIEEELSGQPVNCVYNADFVQGEMLSSVKLGLRSLSAENEAALIVLGDQPQIEAHVVEAILLRYKFKHDKIIIPSYMMHRGHPWLLDRALWQGVIDLKPPDSLRDFLNQNVESIYYLIVDTISVIHDIDTPTDYEQFKP